MGLGVDIRNRMARRAAEEIRNGMIINLGIGIPSLVPNHVPEGIAVMFQAENGIVGMGSGPNKGEEDANLCNAGGFPVTLNPGGSYCDSTAAFAMIRRGLIDLTILGSLEVSGSGDLANWIVPGKKVPGMGGGMELAQKSKKVMVLMNHCEKTGKPKIVKTCTLPLTTRNCVDVIVTELAVLEVRESGLLLTELFPPYDLKNIEKKTEAEFTIKERIRKIPY